MEKIFDYAQQKNLISNFIEEDEEIQFIDDSKIESFHLRFKSNEKIELLIKEYLEENILYIKVEKIKAKEANAFSPPDSKDNFCNFFPGGDTINSKPACKGSSESINSK